MSAGLGTRLRPTTDRIPKCLVPVAGRPLLDYWFERFVPAGVRRVLINTHHFPDQVRQFAAMINRDGWSGNRFQVDEAFEPVLLGSAGTITANRWFADGADIVLIVYAVNLSGIDLKSFLEFHSPHGDPFTMALFRTEAPTRCGIAETDAAMRVVSFVEKPAHPKCNLANAGIYALTADAFREIADMRGFDIGFDVLPRFVGRMRGWEWNGYHLDVGTHESLARAEQDVAAGCLAPGYRREVTWAPSP